MNDVLARFCRRRRRNSYYKLSTSWLTRRDNNTSDIVITRHVVTVSQSMDALYIIFDHSLVA